MHLFSHDAVSLNAFTWAVPRGARRGDARRGSGSRGGRSATCARTATRCRRVRRRDPARRAPEGRRLHASPRRGSACADAARRRCRAARAHAGRRLQLARRRRGRALLRAGRLAHGTALIVGVVAAAVSRSTCRSRSTAPSSSRQRFGFNRMTPRLFVADLAKHAAARRARSACRCCSLVLWLMAAHGRAAGGSTSGWPGRSSTC